MATSLHFCCLLLSLLLFLSHLNNLLPESELSLTLPFPHPMLSLLSTTLPYSLPLALLAAFSHGVSLLRSSARVTLPDLLSPPFSLLLLVSLLSPSSPQVMLTQTAASACLFVLHSAVTLLPRKQKHRKRPNNVLKSAFSVASTPRSQCSSQEETPSLREEGACGNPLLRWRENPKELTPFMGTPASIKVGQVSYSGVRKLLPRVKPPTDTGFG